MSLKVYCRERIFNVINKITEKSRYVIMIVDLNSYKILSLLCKNEELLERGVSLIELINSERDNLEDFDCIYFLSSNIQSVHIMINDFKDEKHTKYKNIHILFTSNISKDNEILDLIASNNFILKRIKSCACINLNFFAYESRIFYSHNSLSLYNYFPLINNDILSQISSILLSVCSCLKIFPSIRYQNSELCRSFSHIFYNSIKNLHTIYNDKNKITNTNINTYTNKNNDIQSDNNNNNHMNNDIYHYNNNNNINDDILLILDRSIDTSILFIHDYSYQSLCYDLLNINTIYEMHFDQTKINEQPNEDKYSNTCNDSYYDDKNIEMAKKKKKKNIDAHTVLFEITNNDQKKEEKEALLSEEDHLWSSYRHHHIQDVNEIIKNEISTFTEKNAVVKIQKKNVLNPTEALDALRSLPQYETLIEQYWLHYYLCNNCFKLLQDKNIVDVGLVEQDICCNVDKYGKELNHQKNLASVNTIITSDEYDQEEKTRLLLLYFMNYININDNDKMKIIESAQLNLFMKKIINEFLKLNLHNSGYYSASDEPIQLSSNKIHHVLENSNKKKIKHYKNVAKNSKYELSRHEPIIKDIILDIYNDTLDKNYFPHVDPTHQQEIKGGHASHENKQNVSRGTIWDFKTENKNQTKKEKKRKILIFIIGGITYPEIKQIYEMSNELDVDIYLGGTNLLTSKVIFDQFKQLPIS
ncbi:syntaxin binding protein, putative [Plasmodium reichenowi]|uniref:Syntaxin binding protein, putative n=1 Tax=Plasmodium reichenowi TaxID=5854 RepID=A0A2P9D8U2_PLARE|nr:syntaxin binding protein, putative [Plasmodium reichenowi]